MSARVASVVAWLVLAAAPLAAAQPSEPQKTIGAGSPPGWSPAAAQQSDAIAVARAFLASADSGDARSAYARFSKVNQRDQSLAQYADRLTQFNTQAGAVLERRITRQTWSKDPAASPGPGTYVAFDLISRFDRIERHCGYLVLFQAPRGGEFRIVRTEEAFLDNATANQIADQQSAEAVEDAWDALSATCPNYPRRPLPEGDSGIGYSTVAEALAGLKGKAGVKFMKEDGWDVAVEDNPLTFWSFPPAGHPAYPSVVKRQIVEEGGVVSVQMGVHCEADKPPCDDLVRTFKQLNARLGRR